MRNTMYELVSKAAAAGLLMDCNLFVTVQLGLRWRDGLCQEVCCLKDSELGFPDVAFGLHLFGWYVTHFLFSTI